MIISPEGVDFQEIFDIIGAEESLSAGKIADAVGISDFADPHERMWKSEF